MRQCPRCASELSSVDKKCPRCGMPVSMMNFEINPDDNDKELLKQNKKAEKKAKKLEKKAEKKERRERESVSNTDFSKFASNGLNESALTEKQQNDRSMSAKRKKRLEQEVTPEFELDEHGEFHIDTKDTRIVDEETSKLLEERFGKNEGTSYSVKKARGDYRQPRLKWWEIYKFAERSFAKRKIKKEVNKAAKIKPDFIKKSKLMLLALFLGWTGAHNFYAKNYKRGWVSVVTFVVWIAVVILAGHVPFFASISVSIGGFAGFINVVWIWIGDFINICFNSFKYRIQKEAFIFRLNIETRANLGEKYIDLDLYKKPWWVRFKVWCQKRKRYWEEDRRDARQRKIEREKRKLQKQQEKEKIEAEIAAFEEKENQLLKNEPKNEPKNVSNIVDKSVLSEISGFEVDGEIVEKPKKKQTSQKQVKAKFETKNSKKKKK